MDNWFIRISWFPFIFRSIYQDLIFPNQIDHIETESFDALVTPEVDHLKHLLTNIGIGPIEVCLCHVKEVKVVFPCISKSSPGRTTKFRQPIGWLVLNEEEILVILIPSQCLLEPLMLRLAMVKHHV